MKIFARKNSVLAVATLVLVLASHGSAAAPVLPNPVLYFVGAEYVEVNGKQIKVRPVFTRSERLKKLVDRAYAEKFPTPGSRVFVEGFKEKKRRDTTTELVPL